MPKNWNRILIESVRTNNEEIIKKCLNFGADINVVDEDGNTPLGNATKRGFLNITKFFLLRKADIFKCGENGKTPLHWAIIRNHFEAVKLLLASSSGVNKPDHLGNIPLYYAVVEGKLSIAEYLINNGAFTDKILPNGQTPLTEAIISGNLKMVELLVRKGALINRLDSCGNTPIALATRCRQMDIVRFLALRDADVCRCGEKRGKSPLVWAACNSDLDLMEILIENGAERTIKLAIAEAAKENNFKVIEFLGKYSFENRIELGDRYIDTSEMTHSLKIIDFPVLASVE